MVVLGTVEDDRSHFKCHRVTGVAQVAIAELVRNATCLHDGRVKQVSAHHQETRVVDHRISQRPNDFLVENGRAYQVVLHGASVGGEQVAMQKTAFE
ncbi:hypothetical protein D3C87_1842050 [compost metagenome]